MRLERELEQLKARVTAAAAKRRLFGSRPAPTHGRYALHEVLGEGAQGVVFAAHDLERGVDVALKFVLVEGGGSTGPVGRRIRREFEALRAIPPHDHVVRYFDLELGEGLCVLSMSLHPGARPGPELERAHVLSALADTVAALGHLHRHDLVHRDVKPQNLVVVDGACVLVDCGLLRTSAGGSSRPTSLSRITQSGARVGTPMFMAPEQSAGKGTTAASDVFSLCITAWRLLHGTDPFGGRTGFARLAAIARHDVERPNVPSEIDGVLSLGLSPNPDARPSLQQIGAAIDRSRSTHNN